MTKPGVVNNGIRPEILTHKSCHRLDFLLPFSVLGGRVDSVASVLGWAVVMGTAVLFTELNLQNPFSKMICSKDSFTESFSALQLPELISNQTIRHSVNNSALRFTDAVLL